MLFILRIKRWNSRNRRVLYVTENQLRKMKYRIIKHGFSIVSVNPCSLHHAYNLHKKNKLVANNFFCEIRMNMARRIRIIEHNNNLT